MLQIKIGASYFDIPDDIQIPISVLNPMVSESAFNEIFTYSFNLQASPRNRSLYNRYVNKQAKITISFQSHILTSGVAIMKMDSDGISVMIKNDAANLRQTLENTSFDVIELPIIPICEKGDSPTLKIEKWNDFMNSKLPQNEPWNEGSFKFPPIYAAPALEWAINEDDNARQINPTLWDKGWLINAYSLEYGNYLSNYGISLPKKASFKVLFPIAGLFDPGNYFIFNSANDINKYYCWFTLDGIGTDPAPSERQGIKVDLIFSDNAATVASKVAIEIAFLSNYFDVTDFGTGIILVENKQGGLTESPVNVNIFILPIFEIENGSGKIEDEKNNWANTVSPCLRISYLIDRIASHFKIKFDKSYLDNIPEYKALIHYSGKVLDQREDDDDFQYNVYGLEIDLNEFKPNCNIVEIFKLLNHLFGLSFNYVNSKLFVNHIKLNLSPFDISKFCIPEFKINEIEGNKSIEYTYGLGDDFWKYGDYYIGPGKNGKYLNYYQNKIKGEGNIDQQEISFSVLIDSNQVATSFKWPELAKSQVYNPNDFISATKFQIGLFRGNYSVTYRININPFVPPIIATADRMICFNNNSILENDIYQYGEIVNYNKKLGTCSIYANSEDSYLDVYANFSNLLKLYNQEIEKNLNLPFHKIIEIMKWDKPIHAIQQRNMSFSGVVKELKFTIGKNIVSPTTITYLVNKKVGEGDFNNDFNDDFNN